MAAAVTSLSGQTQNTPLVVMSPKAKSAGWTGVHKPHTRIGDVLARHKAQADWAETVVDDESLNAQWISLGPGRKTPRRMNGDTREWWIVWSGTLRFTIDGSEPIVATKGVMVQVPFRTLLVSHGGEPTSGAVSSASARCRLPAVGARAVSDRIARPGWPLILGRGSS